MSETETQHEAALFGVLGRLSALEYAVMTLTMTHPAPEAVRTTWAKCAVEIVDRHAEMSSFQSGHYREGLLQGMSRFAQSIDPARP